MAEATSTPKAEAKASELDAVLGNLIDLVDCVSLMLINHMERVDALDGERYQLPLYVGNQAAAILIMGRDAARVALDGAAR